MENSFRASGGSEVAAEARGLTGCVSLPCTVPLLTHSPRIAQIKPRDKMAPQNPLPSIRRVVTTHDDEGTAKVWIDGEVPNISPPGFTDGVSFGLAWVTDSSPADCQTVSRVRGLGQAERGPNVADSIGAWLQTTDGRELPIGELSSESECSRGERGSRAEREEILTTNFFRRQRDRSFVTSTCRRNMYLPCIAPSAWTTALSSLANSK